MLAEKPETHIDIVDMYSMYLRKDYVPLPKMDYVRIARIGQVTFPCLRMRNDNKPLWVKTFGHR